MDSAGGGLLGRFERLEIQAADFHHRDHVVVAWAMLEKYDFVEACTRYASTIRLMAENVGMPEKYNATITFAFMSIIAERKNRGPDSDLESFLNANPDLMDRNLLGGWYSAERLGSATARSQFLMPDRAAAPHS